VSASSTGKGFGVVRGFSLLDAEFPLSCLLEPYDLNLVKNHKLFYHSTLDFMVEYTA
jgi:hypothetical protein